MADEKNESSGFKVVDKRSFNVEKSAREEEPPKASTPAPAAQPSAPPRSQIVSPYEDETAPVEEDLGDEPSGFETLVSYLSTTTMFQLGLLAGPSGERIPPDIPNAKRSIDLLDVLQEKTKGNLTEREARLLDDVLYELRMTFVELQKRLNKKA